MSSSSVSAYLTLMFIGLAPSCVYMVRYYAEPGFPLHSYATLVMGYFAAFGILLVVPIDIASVITDRKSTDTLTEGDSSLYDYDLHTLATIYNIFFTMVLILANVILVFQEYYVTGL